MASTRHKKSRGSHAAFSIFDPNRFGTRLTTAAALVTSFSRRAIQRWRLPIFSRSAVSLGSLASKYRTKRQDCKTITVAKQCLTSSQFFSKMNQGLILLVTKLPMNLATNRIISVSIRSHLAASPSTRPCLGKLNQFFPNTPAAHTGIDINTFEITNRTCIAPVRINAHPDLNKPAQRPIGSFTNEDVGLFLLAENRFYFPFAFLAGTVWP